MKFLYSYTLLLVVSLGVACTSEPSDKASETDTLVITRPGLESPGLESPGLDSLVADSLIEAPKDGLAVGKEPQPQNPPPGQAPAKQQNTSRPGRQQPAEPEVTQQQKPLPAPAPAENKGPMEGNYRLVRVQGDALPLVLDMTTECDMKLLSGELQLRGGKVYFHSITAEECAGQQRPQTKHEASGNYRVDNQRIYINISSGDALGDAVGVIEGSNIRLQQISNDEEQQEVDWLFQLN